MFRKPGAKRAQAVRQRKDSSDEADDDDQETPKEVLVKRRRKNPMLQTTKKETEKSKARPESSSSSDNEEDMLRGSSEFAIRATGTAAPLGPKDQGATATLDIDTDKDKDAQAQFERVQQALEEAEHDPTDRKLYRGQAMYGAKKAKDTAKGNASSGLNRIGPVRAPQFLRQTVRWDFAPDICKDFKETGYCTFGDSCKFMHDRGDYKHGWELERDFEGGHKHEEETNYEISDHENDFPEECPVCFGRFKDPVVTRCKHYFCEKCALESFKKSKKCRVCEQNTGGVFNIAKELIAHINGESTGRHVKKEETDRLTSDESDEDAVANSAAQHIKKEEDAEDNEKPEAEEESGQAEETPIKQEVEEEEEEVVQEGGDEDMAIENEVQGEESGGENESDDGEEEGSDDNK